MLDDKDLQAIGQLMGAMEERLDNKLGEVEQRLDKKLAEAEQRLDKKLGEAEQRISKNTVILMDAEFSKRFDLLAEGIQDIQEKLVPRSRVDDLEDEVKFLKTLFRQMNEDIQKLKKAQ